MNPYSLVNREKKELVTIGYILCAGQFQYYILVNPKKVKKNGSREKFSHLLNKYLLIAYCIPEIALRTGG